MAGAGYKLFTTGSVLTAAEVNTYLQEQTVMVFADATARTAALSGVLAEGMITYLKSTDAVEVYNGSAWVNVASDQTPLTTKGDLFTYSTTDTRLAVGANETRLVADSAATTGLKYVADTTNYAINAKGDLLAGTAADTLTPLTVGGNFAFLSADSSTATGLLWDISAFTSYTPTLTPGSGAFTSATVAGKYKRIGKVCVVKIVVTITTAGTAAGTINVTLPFTSVNDGDAYAAGTFRENAATGVMGVGRVLANSSSCVIAKYDDTSFIASSRTIVGTIIYEVA